MAPAAGPNGVLPVSVLQKNNTPQKHAPPAQAPRGPKPAQPRLKLICRRLPPGLTKAEFQAALGDEWKPGAGKVDWSKYRKGKISTEAYLHVTKPEHVKVLGDHVRATTFQDATKSWQDPALVGPPTLEYAPYPKMPGGRRRHDNRQGTIDQDQEFKDFLESLTNPTTKPPAPDNEGPKEKVKTTPLIEALREKKATREKPSARGNRQNRAETKDDATDKKILSKPGKENALSAGDKNRRLTKADKAQATKEAVKMLNKEATASKPTAATTAASPAPERKRGNVALAKSMLQRDLGVGPAPNRRRGTKREVGPAVSNVGAQAKDIHAPEDKSKQIPATQTPDAVSSDRNKKERPTRAERRAFKAGVADKSNNKATVQDTKGQTPAKTPTPQILKKPQAPIAPKGPAALRAPSESIAAKNNPGHTQAQTTSSKAESLPASAGTPASKPLPASPAPAPMSKQAFLKHANPSQGITEPLIEEVMKTFGGIDKVEIDKRKGFAYVDFAEPQGLQKAMAASPIKIAQGAVQILERKEKIARAPRFNGPSGPPTGPARGGRGGFGPRGRGGRGGARGGHIGASPASNSAESAPADPSVVAPATSAPVASAEAGT